MAPTARPLLPHLASRAGRVGREATRAWVVLVAVLAAVLPLVTTTPPAAALGPDAMVGGCAAASLPGNDDGSSGPVALGFTLQWFGATYTEVYVNNNGNLTFDEPYSSYSGLDLGTIRRPLVAPLFYDIDTRPAASAKPSWAQTTFEGRPAFCAQWNGVGFFNQQVSALSNFQVVLVDRSDLGDGDFDLVFNYDRVATGTYVPAAGYAAADGTFYELPGSRQAGALADTNLVTGLVHRSYNSTQLGRYVFHVRGGLPPSTVEIGTDLTEQELTFAAPADRSLGAGPFDVTAASTSGLPVALSADGACTAVGLTVTPITVGTCTLTATQAGDGTWAPAPPVTRTFTVTPNGQSIAFPPLPDVSVGTAPFAPPVTSTSGLPVALAAEGSCQTSGDLVVLTGAGTCSLTATQPGDALTSPAEPVVRSFQVQPASQVITFEPAGLLAFAPRRVATVGDAAAVPVATATSGLPVEVTASGACAVDGGVLRFLHAGTCRLVARQPGDADHHPADDLMVDVDVVPGPAPAPVDHAPAPAPADPAPAPADPGPAAADPAPADPAPAPASATSTEPRPVPEPDGAWPARAPGEATLTVDGRRASIERRTSAHGVTFIGRSFAASIAAVTASGDPVTLAPDGMLRFVPEQLVRVSGDGFAPGSDVAVWLFSGPQLLGTATVAPDGTFAADLPVPADMPTGRHTLQMNGLTVTGEERSLALGVLVDDAPPATAALVATATDTAPEPAPDTAVATSEEPATAAGTATATATAATATAAGDSSGPDGLAAYAPWDPRQHTDEVVGLQVSAFTLLAVAGVGASASAGAAGASRRKSKVTGSKIKHHKGRWSGRAPGDASWTWRWPLVGRVDGWSLRFPVRVARVSPLLARTANDGAYVRAMAGTGWLGFPVAAVVLAVAALVDTSGHAVPPATWLMLALIVLGVLDAGSGLVAATVFAVGVVTTGHAGDVDAVRTLLGVSVLWFAVGLIASAARPFRRPAAASAQDRWARLGDWVIGPLLGAWAAQKMVGALAGLAGRQLPFAAMADEAAVVVLVALVARMALESLCGAWYPERLQAVAPEKIPFCGPAQRVAATLLRAAIFVLAAAAFLGNVWQLWVGTVMFVVPQLLKIVEHRFPNFPAVYRALPKGVVKTVVMMVLGTWFGRWVAGLVDDPARLLADGFVILALPGLVLSCVDLVGRDGADRNLGGRDHVVGAGFVAAGVLLALGIVQV